MSFLQRGYKLIKTADICIKYPTSGSYTFSTQSSLNVQTVCKTSTQNGNTNADSNHENGHAKVNISLHIHIFIHMYIYLNTYICR